MRYTGWGHPGRGVPLTSLNRMEANLCPNPSVQLIKTILHSSHSTVSPFSLVKVGPWDHAAHETVPRSRVKFKGVLQRTESLIFITRNSKFAMAAISQGMASHPLCLPSTSGLAPPGYLR